MNTPPLSSSKIMDDKTALHTAARRYCQERFSDWIKTYTDLQAREKWQVENLFKPGWDYSKEAYGVFPRYRIDQAIQVEVERLAPEATESLEALRSQLIHASDPAEERLTCELKNAIALTALREEAEDYKAFIQALRESDLPNIFPLPYRRVITQAESDDYWNRLKLAWDISKDYWFPLRTDSTPANMMAFHVDYIAEMDGLSLLHKALEMRGISRVFQLHEFGRFEPEYEIELSVLEPAYRGGGEQYCTSEAVDWVVYASHESSITIAGDWLTEIFREKWPEWAERTYKGPYSTEDLCGTWESK